MLWVGGHILIAGAHELGWHTPHEALMGVAEAVRDVTGVGGVLGWGAETLVSAVVGFAVGSFVVGVLALIHRPKTSPHPAGHP
jgi:hypothetical protein